MSDMPPRLPRSKSFLGIHHDFHARDTTDRRIGARTTPEMIEEIIDKVGPDYIQTDCKGHHGLSSYPTKVGNQAPVIVGDPLRIWRDVTARRGVALYVHYSGIFDERAIQLHPDWALIDKDGVPSVKNVSVHSPYLDELMLPQIHELITEYGIDGIWCDGDCWSTALDYSPAALAAFRAETGITTVPKEPGDPGLVEFAAFARESFRRYLRKWVDAAHGWSPDFQIAGNWAFTSFMPEPVTADVDFLSGDSAPTFGSYPRLEARMMALQGKPWDVMTWGFGGMFTLEGTSVVGLKSAVQLEQEAATILSLGGGYQSVSNQRLDGSINAWHLDVMAEVAKFCRARQALSHNGELVPQIALVHAGEASYRPADPLFKSLGEVDGLLGILGALLTSQQVVSMVQEHQFGDTMGDYPLIVVPGWPGLSDTLRDRLLAYVEAGGNLIVIGPTMVERFAAALDIEFTGALEPGATRFIEYAGQLDGHVGDYRAVRLGERAVEFAPVREEFDFTSASGTLASIATYGRGRVAGVYFDFGESYHRAMSAIARRFIAGLARELFPEPTVEVSGSQFVDVVLTRKDGRTIVHLSNTAGQGDNRRVHILDEVPPIGPLEVRLRRATRPTAVTLEPGGVIPDWDYADGAAVVRVARLEIHTMVVVEG